MKHQTPEATSEIAVDELGYVRTNAEFRDISKMKNLNEEGDNINQKQPHEAVLTNLVCN